MLFATDENQMGRIERSSGKSRYNLAMKRLRRWMFNGVAALSLLLCAMMGFFWVMSYTDSLPVVRPYYLRLCVVEVRSSAMQLRYEAILNDGSICVRWLDLRGGIISLNYINIYA